MVYAFIGCLTTNQIKGVFAMKQTYGQLQLKEGFPTSSILKLAKSIFKEKPFTCQMLYDEQLRYYGKEHRNKRLTATAIAQLMNRGFLVRHPEKSDNNLTMYRVLDKSGKPKMLSRKLGYMDILKIIKEKFKAKSFTKQNVSEAIDGHPDVSFHMRTLEKKGLINCKRRDFRGKHYRLVWDMTDQTDQASHTDRQTNHVASGPATQLHEQPAPVEVPPAPVQVRRNQIIDREVLRSLDIPLDLIGEAIVMKITALRRQIDDLETAELTYKRQLDEMQKNAHTQSRIIASLNDKVTALSKDTPRHSKATIANLGEIARISTLKKR